MDPELRFLNLSWESKTGEDLSLLPLLTMSIKCGIFEHTKKEVVGGLVTSQKFIFAHLLPRLTGLVNVLTNRNKGASELKKGIELGKVKFSHPNITPFYPHF